VQGVEAVAVALGRGLLLLLLLLLGLGMQGDGVGVRSKLIAEGPWPFDAHGSAPLLVLLLASLLLLLLLLKELFVPTQLPLLPYLPLLLLCCSQVCTCAALQQLCQYCLQPR